jgi:beta-phosphoglucomutase-like phosphatase (HAD superfamily)
LLKYPRRKIEIPGYIKGLIFDCDGTLVDSMPLHMKAWEYAINNAGAVWDYDFFFSKKGMPGKDIIELYNQHFAKNIFFVETMQVKQEYFHRHRKDFQPIQPIVNIVLRYKDILPMAVASGGIQENVCLQLEALGIKEYFKAIITADDDIKPKPSPDIFLEAAVRLGVSPNLCQVFEDGDLGLQAAHEASMIATDVRPFL